jgi:ATP-dependent exoDNAse (exonuclease V) beta subunit
LTADTFEREALERAGELERIGFGALVKLGKKGYPLSGWPKPNPARTPEERRDEAMRERANVRVFAAMLRRFDALLAQEHLLTFGEVLVRATRMVLEYPEIRAALQGRWHHAIVDEFQDTNRAQVAFLRAIFGDALRPVLAVGDVRQAIYEWNGADPQGIVRFGELDGCRLHPLSENRRSLQPILDVAHHAIGGRGAIPEQFHQRLNAHRGDANALAVRFELFAGDDALECEAAAIAAEIRRLIEGGAAKASDCAVLLRSRTRASIYADALRSAGLAVQLDGGVGFFEAPEVREVVAWLRLVETPDDPFALVTVLQSAAIGLSDGAVAHLAAGGTLARSALLAALSPELSLQERGRVERFRAIARVVCELGDVPLVDAVRTVVLASGAEIARTADPGRLDQTRANLEKLVRFAADLSQDRPLARVRDLVEELRVRDELELDLPPAELDGDRVTIMTIHRSKGLEWPFVFVANCSHGAFPANGGVNDVVAMYDETQRVFALKHGSDGRATLRWYMTRSPHDERGVVAETTSKNSNEEFRLLYVALTRARNAVYVSGRIDARGTESKCATAVREWITAAGGDPEAHRFSAAGVAAHASPAAAAAAGTAEQTLFGRLARIDALRALRPERRGALSYSAMELQERCPRRARYHYVFGLPDLADDASAVSLGEEESVSREVRDPARFGRIVHKALEDDARARIAATPRDLDRFVADAVEAEEGTEDEARSAAIAVRAAAVLLERYDPIDAERPFTVTIDGVVLGGYIDLLARDADGRLVIVDYKTGLTPSEHYALQFGLYAAAVRHEYGEEPVCVLLRISGADVHAEALAPASDAVLRTAIAASRAMESDEARPGPGCRLCPYAHDVCRDAPDPQAA